MYFIFVQNSVICYSGDPIVSCLKPKYKQEQAGAELGQAQDKLKVIVEVPVKIGADVEVSVNYYKPVLVLEFTKLILNST